MSSAPELGQAGAPVEKTPKRSGPKQLKIGRYSLGDTLGHGSFGKVKVAMHELTKHKVAVKILDRQKIKSLDVAEKIRREIQVLKLFRHPHIIKLYEVITTPSHIFMIMEFVSGGELFDFIVNKGKSTEDNARVIFQQIISGVRYCHHHKVVHRDLKPENLLMDSNGDVKLADFGLSNLMKDGEFLSSSCGSPNYAAPEVVSGKLYAGPEVDVWSCGIILYALLCGTLPFDDRNVTVLFKKIKSGQFYIPPYLSPSIVDLLTKMLQVSPVKRITIQGIVEHEWFKQNLPEHLFPPLGEMATTQIDSSVIAEVCQKLNVSAADVMGALRGDREHDQLAVAYHLVLDSRSASKSAPISTGMTATSSTPPGGSFSMSDDVIASIQDTPTIKKQSKTMPTVSSAVNNSRVTRTFKRSKWHLGIRSQSRPQDIMAEIFRKLKALDFQWKIVTPYFIRCKHTQPVSGLVVKLDLQLYQIDHKNYLLDFKCVNPSEEEMSQALQEQQQSGAGQGGEDGASPQHTRHFTMEFFEICSRLITSLAQ